MAAETPEKLEALEPACDGFSIAPMQWTVRAWPGGGHILEVDGFAMRCAIGRGGVKADKHEGDGATPIGVWPLREAFYRPDRLPMPETRLKMTPLDPHDGWCDAAGDPNYNKPVRLPYAASHEELWRSDAIYDVIVVMGYNDDPVVDGKGSAIFLHLARSDYSPTAGCVAVQLEDMMKLLVLAEPGTEILVEDA
jgi:L,D-peptidoglycan transpeptidase YkuD (ErfK/YbiS/YcfS/YnhG family)